MSLSYSQQALVRGCRQPALASMLQQPRQTPSRAHAILPDIGCATSQPCAQNSHTVPNRSGNYTISLLIRPRDRRHWGTPLPGPLPCCRGEGEASPVPGVVHAGDSSVTDPFTGWSPVDAIILTIIANSAGVRWNEHIAGYYVVIGKIPIIHAAAKVIARVVIAVASFAIP